MTLLIGTDEAGYGPNLGPLVVAATVWRGGEDVDIDSLPQRVGGCIASGDEALEDGPRIGMGDSKALYSPQKGLSLLERGVLAALAATGRLTCEWAQVWKRIAPCSLAARDAEPWHNGFAPKLPLETCAKDLKRSAARLRGGLENAGVSILHLRARVVFPAQFNAIVDQCGGKGAALTHITLGLIAELLGELPGEPATIVCDKHGGRDYYIEPLQRQFADTLIEVARESRDLSVYRFGQHPERREIHFRTCGEACLMTALASMTAKYMRELCMRAFNTFWCTRITDLRPTAGYPSDSHRFRRDIAAVQQELGIPDSVLWRTK